MNKIIFTLGLCLFLFAGCSDYYAISDKTNSSGFWFNSTVNESLYNATANGTVPVLRYSVRDVFIDKRLSALDMVVQSGSSLFIGGSDGARFSASEFVAPSVNATVVTTAVDSNFFVQYPHEGSTFLTNINQDINPNSSAIVSAGARTGEGLVIQKFNGNNTRPYLGVLGGLRGDIQIMTTRSNAFPLTNTGNNKISIGFYKDLNVTDNSLITYNEREFVLEIGQTNITSYQNHIFENVTYFNETYIASPNPARTSPDSVIGKVSLFARDDGNLYIKRGDGTVKRITTANSGSNIWTEEQKFNNHTTFYGDVILDNAVYNGGLVGYACIDESGRLFKSITPCHLTSSTFNSSTIADPTLGDETD